MATIGKRTIFVGPADSANHKPLNVEGKAIAATAPGTVMAFAATGLAINAAAAIDHQTYLLVADYDQQRSRTVDDAWTINENMVAIQLRSGEVANVLVATGQTIVRGDQLIRNGAGLLVKQALETEEALCVADETITTTATQLVRVRRTS